jgi:hypothetical protein
MISYDVADGTTIKIRVGESVRVNAIPVPSESTDPRKASWKVTSVSGKGMACSVKNGTITGLREGTANVKCTLKSSGSSKKVETSFIVEVSNNAPKIKKTNVGDRKCKLTLKSSATYYYDPYNEINNVTVADPKTATSGNDYSKMTHKKNRNLILKVSSLADTASRIIVWHSSDANVVSIANVDNVHPIPSAFYAAAKGKGGTSQQEISINGTGKAYIYAVSIPEDVYWTQYSEDLTPLFKQIESGYKFTKNDRINVAVCKVTVKAPASRVHVTEMDGTKVSKNTTLEMKVGSSVSLLGWINEGNTSDNRLTWSAKGGVVKVKDGLITAKKAGNAEVIVKSGKIKTTFKVKVQ